MLTDIFAARYAAIPMWSTFGESERRLLVQTFRLVNEQLFPPWVDGKEEPRAKAIWSTVHDRLSMELGLQELSPLGYWSKRNLFGTEQSYWEQLSISQVCNTFVCAAYDPAVPADRFIKERLSFIEIAFREKEGAVDAFNASLPLSLLEAKRADATALHSGAFRGVSRAKSLQDANDAFNANFRTLVHEVNQRFKQAGAKLHYHNGFIQISADVRIAEVLETPFWNLVSDPKWKNVDTDIKESIDLRDSGGRDPAFYAAKALESTIKIISTEKGWTRGDEKGAHGFIDNLAAVKNGQFIARWEQAALKAIFSDVRNELGHGPGGEQMPELSLQQTNWAIESCMSWIKSLIQRA